MFKHHYFLLNMKYFVLQQVWSIGSGNMEVYLTYITRLTYHLFALNHANHVSWIPVHIPNSLLLPKMHPDVNEHFQQGRFTVNKTGKLFLNTGLNHCQEQNIKNFNHHSRLLSLTYSPDQLFSYLVSGPEVAKLVSFSEKMISQYHDVGIFTMSKLTRTIRLWNMLNLYTKHISNMGAYSYTKRIYFTIYSVELTALPQQSTPSCHQSLLENMNMKRLLGTN